MTIILIIGTQIDYCCIKSFFRQIDPAHSSYLGLNEDTQQNNERKMHINAQVTAVIMMLEFLGNFHIVVIFMEWGELTRFLISYFFMLLHFLVLSYAHLKNTRGNKNRIIQYGIPIDFNRIRILDFSVPFKRKRIQ